MWGSHNIRKLYVLLELLHIHIVNFTIPGKSVPALTENHVQKGSTLVDRSNLRRIFGFVRQDTFLAW